MPYDTESYVHRIGRTGRAGRSGEAILFIAPRERNMLRIIERATRQPIEPMNLPTVDDVNPRRVAKFKERIGAALERRRRTRCTARSSRSTCTRPAPTWSTSPRRSRASRRATRR